jgi:predicted enzyme related to lactoylglutathione lyase
MIRSIVGAAVLAGVALSACTNPGNADSKKQNVDTTVNRTTGDMKNLISIVEIPTIDFSRAVKFYQAILDVAIEEVDMDGVKMGVFPGNGEGVSVALIRGNDYKPSLDGTIVYLNAGDDLQIVLDKVERNGGKVVVPKSEISPEMGFFAMFIDTEGNKLGLHSKK